MKEFTSFDMRKLKSVSHWIDRKAKMKAYDAMQDGKAESIRQARQLANQHESLEKAISLIEGLMHDQCE